MAEIKTLDSIITVNNEEYAVIAEEAKKVTHTLTITAGKESIEFDGSADKTINVAAGGSADSADRANEIKVYLDNRTEYATITISQNDPNDNNGALGDIWFKYN